MMKLEEQRVAIAKACGWTHIRPEPDRNPDNDRMSYLAGSLRGMPYDLSEVPDYLNDLNAMAKAEKYLTPMEAVEYRTHWLWHVYHKGLPVERIPLAAPIDATAAQRAEAFLRVKGQWTDTNES